MLVVVAGLETFKSHGFPGSQISLGGLFGVQFAWIWCPPIFQQMGSVFSDTILMFYSDYIMPESPDIIKSIKLISLTALWLCFICFALHPEA